MVVRAASLVIASTALGDEGREMYSIGCTVGSFSQTIALP